MKISKINFFGDSICFGQGVSLYKGWIPKIAVELDQRSESNDRAIVVTNNGVNGRTSRQALETMSYEIFGDTPDILIVQFGMNDCNYWDSDKGFPRVTPSSFKANLCEIIDRAYHFGVVDIILNTNHPTTRDNEFFHNTERTYEASNKEYNEIIREVAKMREKVILNDMEKTIRDEINSSKEIQAYVIEDGLHLSEEGHTLYYKTMLPILVNLLDLDE